MNDDADLLGHIWVEGRCKRCEMYLREVPVDVRCHARDWLHAEQEPDEKRRVTRA